MESKDGGTDCSASMITDSLKAFLFMTAQHHIMRWLDTRPFMCAVNAAKQSQSSIEKEVRLCPVNS